MRRCTMLCLLLAGLFLLLSCGHVVRSGTLTLASTKHGADMLGAKYVLVKKNATAIASKPIFIFPLGTPRDYDAMKKILAENNGDVLTNVRIHAKSMVFLIFGNNSVQVSADVWRIATTAELTDPVNEELRTMAELGDDVYPRHALGGGTL